jgi:hypothetical protein
MVVRMEKREEASSTSKMAGSTPHCLAMAHALHSQTKKNALKRRVEVLFGAITVGGGRGLKERGRATGRAVEC